MMLISLLLVLAIERSGVKTPHWHIEYYGTRYRSWLTDKGWLSEDSADWQVWLYLLLPALLLGFLESWLLGAFLTFVEQTLILFVCIGCPALRATYKHFLQAADRGDLEACAHYSDQLGHCEEPASEEQTAASREGKTFGQHLTWLNYQHYAAVILWFLAFGAPGALFYSVTRVVHEGFCREGTSQQSATARLLFALDFIPVRIVSFGMLMMGHFSRAFPLWLRYLSDFTVMPGRLLTEVAGQAEVLSPEEQSAQQANAAVEPKVLVRLAKRNILFLMAVTAVLTLTGLLP
ncbi:beta-lactamase regulator AmpE [Alteromonas sp. ASW11-19]|uniref:Beta-lactamase regulator AmpE n=1 Tax=Alteromonas salexigens TaxID=2982530 RepID=A0ABT2VQG9_9ALTE|nr:beta-lactamase regulator AmpE [Alteromonas salexigens]MCU7555552.1 beta-lactamase regulator AmpE [Alteromonas salexigens]